jgi:hypothetical protein
MADVNAPKQKRLIDYTQQRGKQLPCSHPSYSKERARMQRDEAPLRRSSVPSFDRNSKFNLARSAGILFQETLEVLRNINNCDGNEEVVHFYLKIPTREVRRGRSSDLRERFLLDGHQKEPKFIGSIVQLRLTDPCERRCKKRVGLPDSVSFNSDLSDAWTKEEKKTYAYL